MDDTALTVATVVTVATVTTEHVWDEIIIFPSAKEAKLKAREINGNVVTPRILIVGPKLENLVGMRTKRVTIIRGNICTVAQKIRFNTLVRKAKLTLVHDGILVGDSLYE